MNTSLETMSLRFTEECALNEFVFQAWWPLDFVGYYHTRSGPILVLVGDSYQRWIANTITAIADFYRRSSLSLTRKCSSVLEIRLLIFISRLKFKCFLLATLDVWFDPGCTALHCAIEVHGKVISGRENINSKQTIHHLALRGADLNKPVNINYSLSWWRRG